MYMYGMDMGVQVWPVHKAGSTYTLLVANMTVFGKILTFCVRNKERKVY